MTIAISLGGMISGVSGMLIARFVFEGLQKFNRQRGAPSLL